MDTVHDTSVIELRSRALDRAESSARAAIRDLLLEADDALAAVLDEDVDSVFRLHRLVNRSVAIVLDHHLSTAWNWRPSA